MTIEERAKDYAQAYTPKESAVQYAVERAYGDGASDQDIISRANQKKIDIDKACEALYIIQDLLNADLMDIEKAKDIMTKALEEKYMNQQKLPIEFTTYREFAEAVTSGWYNTVEKATYLLNCFYIFSQNNQRDIQKKIDCSLDGRVKGVTVRQKIVDKACEWFRQENSHATEEWLDEQCEKLKKAMEE